MCQSEAHHGALNVAREARGIDFSVATTGVMEVLHAKRKTGGVRGGSVRAGEALPSSCHPALPGGETPAAGRKLLRAKPPRLLSTQFAVELVMLSELGGTSGMVLNALSAPDGETEAQRSEVSCEWVPAGRRGQIPAIPAFCAPRPASHRLRSFTVSAIVSVVSHRLASHLYYYLLSSFPNRCFCLLNK